MSFQNHSTEILEWSGKALCIQVHTPCFVAKERRIVVTLVASDVCFPPALKDSIFNVFRVLITSALLEVYYIWFLYFTNNYLAFQSSTIITVQ